MKIKYSPIYLFILIVLFACSKKHDILAWIDEESISQTTFSNYVEYKASDKQSSKQQSSKQQSELLNELIDSEALSLAMEKSTLYQSNQLNIEINERRKQILFERYFETFFDKNLTDKALKEFHESEQNTLEIEKAHVAHILIRTHTKMDVGEREKQYEKALAAYTKVKSGSDFAAVAAAYSDDSLTANKGGDLGWIEKDQINAQFTVNAFNDLNQGEVSKPFQSRFGFHVVKVIEEPKMVKKPLESVREELMAMLKTQLKEQEIARLMSSVSIKRTM